MRKLTYFIATTADGFIAASDGSFDAFLQEGEHLGDLVAEYPETFPGHVRDLLGVTGGNRTFDAVLMGRTTYEVGLRGGITSPYPHLEQHVFSGSMTSSPDPAVRLVSADAVGYVRALKAREGRGIWLCGGGQLAGELFEEIDEVVLKVNPALLGAGVPLFGRAVPPTRLRLVERKAYDNGVTRLHYALR